MITKNIRGLIRIASLLSVIILLVYGYVNHKYINQISDSYNKILKTSLENTSTVQNIARNSSLRLVELNSLLNVNSKISSEKRIAEIYDLITKNDIYYEAFSLLPLTDNQKNGFAELTEFRKKCLSQMDSFIHVVKKGSLVEATVYFEKTVQPDEQLYGAKQIGFASSFRNEAYSNATTVESISAKVSFLNILVSFVILFIIIISLLYLILLVISFFRELRWSGIAGDNVTVVNE
ncbi:MAG: MCP four helix bundle domain-containing protein [Bacteroidota bacterium]